MIDAYLAIGVFTGVVMLSVAAVLAVRLTLLGDGTVALTINDARTETIPANLKLLAALAELDIYLPAACGGRGTCGQCRVVVNGTDERVLATEAARLRRTEIARGMRLACQVTVRSDLAVEVPEEILQSRRIVCRVASARNVATLIREIVLEVPEGESFTFVAGGYVQVECPAYGRLAFDEFELGAELRGEWQRMGILDCAAIGKEPTTRAYSLANYPGERGVVLNVRIALPPSDAPGVPAGVASSYLFSLRPGDRVAISGPYGAMHAATGDREMVMVGGGAGMAPLRSIIFDQLLRVGTERTISFWYGARSERELFYAEQFEALAEPHPNFRWVVALSEDSGEAWTGEQGYIHDVLRARFLDRHPEPEECEYYLCGPPLMVTAVLRELREAGVPREQIFSDDFGG